MASFNLYLKETKAEKPTAIYLLFDDGHNRAKLYIQQSIHPKNWNSEGGKASKKLTGFSDFNTKLKQITDECQNIYINLTKDGTFSLEKLKEDFKTYLDTKNGKITAPVITEDSKPLHFIDFYQSYMKQVENLKSKSTLKSHKTTVNNLVEFQKKWGKPLTFQNIDLEFFHSFMDFTQVVKKYKPNSIGKLVKNIKVVLNEATEQQVNTNYAYKSKRFQAPYQEVDNIYLDVEELDRIFDFDFGKDKRLNNARDLFLIGCWTGLRYSDFSQLTKANYTTIDGVEYVSVKTQKTGEKVVIPLHTIVKKILSKYKDTATGFPRNISGQKLNDYLKDIGKKVGIDEPVTQHHVQGKLKVQKTCPKYELICTHTARRSFATNLYKSGLGSIHIMKITGHRTEKSFLTYIKMSKEENAQALHQHWQKMTKLKKVV